VRRDSRAADIPRWTLSLVALFGVICAVWGALGLTVFYYSAHLTTRTVYALRTFKTMSGGVAVGLFLAWWMSGQIAPFFKKRSRGPTTSYQPDEPNADTTPRRLS
jgi:hypothetical protein